MKQQNKRKDKMYYAKKGIDNRGLIKWFASGNTDIEKKYEWVRQQILDGNIPRRNTPHLLTRVQLDRRNYKSLEHYIKCIEANMNYNNIVARVLGESQVGHKSGVKRVKSGRQITLGDVLELERGCSFCSKFAYRTGTCPYCKTEY